MTTPGLPIPPKPCLTCAQPTTNKGQRCDTCATTKRRTHNQARAYYQRAEWKRLRLLAITRDHQQCVICTGTHRLTAHHIQARHEGGPDSLPNLTTLCHQCHNEVERGHTHALTRLSTHLDASPHH